MNYSSDIENTVKNTSAYNPLPQVPKNRALTHPKNVTASLLALLKEPDLKAVKDLMPSAIALRYKIVPLVKAANRLQIAIASLDDVALLDEIKWVLGKEIDPLPAEQDVIEEALRKIYGLGAETVGRLLSDHSEGIFVDLTASLTSDLDDEGEEASIVRFVNELLIESFQERATDIHIEPSESSLRIRYRTDGILYEFPVPESLRHLHAAIVSRIKIMANLNIAEQRLPQDGRIKVRTGQKDLDLRISILPTPFGESVNLRILNSHQVNLDLKCLGLLPRDQNIIENLIEKPHGIILVTGPTGSGKTTTLYSCLNRLIDSEKKIITAEDPIEYQLPGITQIQVNQAIGLTFANGLRSMLRHDPDIMLVGEIRDHETAEVTIQVAMTGHLVFSTLHTNDAASAVARLINMGIEPYLIAASVECIIAQRLVRVICPKCKFMVTEHNGKTELIQRLFAKDAQFYHGRGCEYCKNSGYFGRTAIYEFLLVDDEIRDHVVKKTPANQLRQIAMEKGMVSLRQDGIEKINLGVTTLEEVLRVTQEVEG
ncbi:MAG: GspE/PulE family protein [bacterium]